MNAELVESHALQWDKSIFFYYYDFVSRNTSINIERFEKAYLVINEKIFKQTITIITSFIMLDFDDNQYNFLHGLQKQDVTIAIKCKSMKIGVVGFKFVQFINCKWQLMYDPCVAKGNTSMHQQTQLIVIFMSVIDYHYVAIVLLQHSYFGFFLLFLFCYTTCIVVIISMNVLIVMTILVKNA